MFQRIPAGTKLYRGCSRVPEIGTEDIVYFSLSKTTAAGYARGCIAAVETLKDIDLLDLSQGDTWKKLDSLDWSKYSLAYEAYKGILSARTDKNDFINTTIQSGFFQDGKVDSETPCKEDPAKKCVTLDWHGIKWGPEQGQFKRYSSEMVDLQFIEALQGKCKEAGFCISGIYAPPLPSWAHRMHDDRGVLHKNVFHDEVALFGLPADTVKLVEAGGKRRKTRRRKSTRKTRSKK